MRDGWIGELKCHALRAGVLIGVGATGYQVWVWWRNRDEDRRARYVYSRARRGVLPGDGKSVCLYCAHADGLVPEAACCLVDVPATRCARHWHRPSRVTFPIPEEGLRLACYGGARASDSGNAMLQVEMRGKLSRTGQQSVGGDPVACAMVPRLLLFVGLLMQDDPDLVHSRRWNAEDNHPRPAEGGGRGGTDHTLDGQRADSDSPRFSLTTGPGDQGRAGDQSQSRGIHPFTGAQHRLDADERDMREAGERGNDQSTPPGLYQNQHRGEATRDRATQVAVGVDGPPCRDTDLAECGEMPKLGGTARIFQHADGDHPHSTAMTIHAVKLDYHKRSDAKTIDRAVRSRAYVDYVLDGATPDEATAMSKLEPQARYLLPLSTSVKMCIADKDSAANEKYGLCVRNFPVDNPAPDIRMIGLLREIAKCAGEWLGKQYLKRKCAWGDLDLREFYPGGWTKERADAVWFSMCGMSLDDLVKDGSHHLTRQCFVKAAEALTKEKARIIQSRSDTVTMFESFTCKVFADAIFDPGTFESSSIKHCDPHELAKRIAGHGARFKRGRVLSADFKSWEAYLTLAKRDATENVGIEAFLDVLGADNSTAHVAIADRKKRRLNLRGKFHKVTAKDFGRESGDSGTSTLNFFVNLIFTTGLDVRIAEEMGGDTDPRNAWMRRANNKAWISSIHEGDDTLLFFSERVVRALTPDRLMRIILEYYRTLGVVIEPATEAGVVEDSSALQTMDGRVEFVSRLWSLQEECFSIPLLPKTIRTASVTFSKQDIRRAAWSTGLSGMYNTVRHPLLYALYSFVFAIGRDVEGARLEGFKGRALSTWANGHDVLTQVCRLRQASCETDDVARTMVHRDHPNLSPEVQRDLEDRLEAMAKHPDNCWTEVHDLLLEVVKLLE